MEVMIFLAVSGFMFIIAAAFVSGKQSNAEFRQGINDINTQIQQTINDVSNGFYPSGSSFTCSASASGLTISGGSGPEQGANQGCIFLGKVIQFGVNGTNGTGYDVYTLAGSQFANGAAGGNPPSNLAQAFPLTVDDNSVPPTPGGCTEVCRPPIPGYTPRVTGINLTELKTLEWGLAATKMTDNGSSIGAVGFISSFASQTGVSLNSGSQTVNVYAVPSNFGDTESTTVRNINLRLSDSDIRPNPDIVICFDGGNGKYGSVTIGGSTSSQRLSTSMRISSGTPPPGC